MDIAIISTLGLIMGIVTAISGGAGVFAVPTMLALGIPPVATLALNRVSDLGVIAGAIRNYSKLPEFCLKIALIAAAPLTIGAIAGAHFSVSVSESFLKIFILCAVCVGIVILLYPVRPKGTSKPANYWVGIPALLVVGFWSGSVGMAGATFAVIALVLLFNRSYLSARATDVAAEVPETIISSGILLWHANTQPALIAAMFISSLIGAYIGSKLAINKGSLFVRKAMVGISCLMIAKVIYDLITTQA